MGRSIEAMLSNLLDNGQIYTRNLKSLAERDLLYIAYR